jgi:hypothetical protein
MGREVKIEQQIEVGAGSHRYCVVEGWPQLPAGMTVQEVVAVACDSEGRVYVFNRGSHPIMIFDRTGKFVDSFPSDLFAHPHGITVGPDNTVYCVDDFDHTVKVFSPTGQSLLVLGKSGEFSNTGAVTIDYRTVERSGPPFNYPTDLAVAPSGDLYVTDGYGNARVHQFSPDGNLLASWGESGAGPGQFQVPHGIAISGDGIVYVADRENCRIQRFDLQGHFIDQWTDVVRPTEVFVTGDGTVYVAELGARAGRWPGWPDAPVDAIGGRLSIFDSGGQLLARWGGGDSPCAPGDFFAPHDVWVDRFGDIYVSEVVWSAGANKGAVSPQCHTLQKFSRIHS